MTEARRGTLARRRAGVRGESFGIYLLLAPYVLGTLLLVAAPAAITSGSRSSATTC